MKDLKDKKAKTKKKSTVVVSQNGKVFVTATFNNTLVSISNDKGDVVTWSSSGSRGFKGARKSTPYAATKAAEQAGAAAYAGGVREVAIFVKGAGLGRISSIKALKSAGLNVVSISDQTPMPHNGCRPKNRRRI